MFQPLDHSRNLSLRLSQVLDEIGVNEDLVMRRRWASTLAETIWNIDMHLDNVVYTAYYFGSMNEGSTTEGLYSDMDVLFSNDNIKVLEDLSEWQPNRKQYLMVRDDTVSPGYCLLQAVRSDTPLPERHIENEHHSRDHTGRVLLRHSKCLGHIQADQIRHGPAAARHAQPGERDIDCVFALQSSAWPKEANAWLQKQNVSDWPTEDMKRYSAEQGCFVVPVASKAGVYEDTEWRISTSLAERCLMWNLNITQLRCYIVMKMIIKTFLKPRSISEESVSSFMCKNILFHVIASSRASSEWNEGSLVIWLNQCLQVLLNSILTEHCPHFIIPQNNLLAGKLSAEVKHQLADVICKRIENIEQSLLDIQIDNLGNRLTVKSGGISESDLVSNYDNSINVAAKNINLIALNLSTCIKQTLRKLCKNVCFDQILTIRVFKLCLMSLVGSRLEQAAISLYTPFYCSYIGSSKASVDIHNARVISDEALRWFYFGLNSDISSGKLKLASALYCAGDLEICETLLGDIKLQLSQTTVESRCYCYMQNNRTCSNEFVKLCYEIYEAAIKQGIAFCVTFLPREVNCIPDELKYEMFRSTEEDHPYRSKIDFWMDWAVVDSLPYLHFLLYKVYSQLNMPADKQQALDDLTRTINTDPNLRHKETALNLLGQCMEQENRHDEALRCYIDSLNVRARNNVAKWHVCCMLSRRVNQRVAQN